jgi:hypothetical protein
MNLRFVAVDRFFRPRRRHSRERSAVWVSRTQDGAQ